MLETLQIVSVVIIWEHKGNLLINHRSFANEKPYDTAYVLTSFFIFFELWKKQK